MDKVVELYMNGVIALTLLIGLGLMFLLASYVWDKAFRSFLIFIGSWDIFIEILHDRFHRKEKWWTRLL